MATHRPLTDQDRDQVKALHAEGLGRNAIAKRIGRSAWLVTKIAREAGLDFDRSNHPQLQVATAARVADGRARRAKLALELLDDIALIREQLRSQIMAYSVGGKDNFLSFGEVPRPSPRDLMYLSTAIGNLTDRHIRLDEYGADPGVDAAKSMLGALAKGLGAAYDQLTQPPPPADGD